jgi:hypothetical protein
MIREGNFHQSHIPFRFSVDHFPFHQIPIGESNPDFSFTRNTMIGSDDPSVVTDNETIHESTIIADDRNYSVKGEDCSLAVGEEGICSVSPKGF